MSPIVKLMAYTAKLANRTYVVGYSGSGKSTLAKELSQESGYPVVSLDDDPRWWEMIANDPEHKHLVPNSPEWVNCCNLMNIITFDALGKLGSKPAIVEGCQLLAVNPRHLDGFLVLMATPASQICQWRRQRNSHTEVGTNADAVAGGDELSNKLIEADRTMWWKWA